MGPKMALGLLADIWISPADKRLGRELKEWALYREKRMAKSDVCQHSYREILVDPDVLRNFYLTNFEPVDFEKRDELLDLTEQLNDAIKEIIRTKLTSRQSEVVQQIHFEKKTQMEVAYKLQLCQTTVHKILSGNIDYFAGKKRYGGAYKKIKKLCVADDKINSIINRIEELKAELADF